MMEQIIDPPNLGFWTLVVIYFQSILAIFQKKSVACKWNWKDLKANKSSENNKKKIFLNHFFYMMEQIIDPSNLNFWTLAVILSKYYCKFSKKVVGCNWNWKVLLVQQNVAHFVALIKQCLNTCRNKGQYDDFYL